MRLMIDADEIENATSSDIEIYSFDLVPYIKVEDLLNFIDNLPTAYDIKSVVEELERVKQNALSTCLYDDLCFANGIQTAIEIIKDGVNNEN